MHSPTLGDWAEGLHLTATGLTRDQRKQVRDVVEAAGGRYWAQKAQYCGAAPVIHSDYDSRLTLS